MEALIDRRKELTRLICHREQLLDKTAHDGCNERSPHAMAHHIANDDACPGITQRKHVEEITTNCGRWKVTMEKAKRALLLRFRSPKRGILFRQKDLLDFP